MKPMFLALCLEAEAAEVERLREALGREYLPCELTWVDRCEAFRLALACGRTHDFILAADDVPGCPADVALELAQTAWPGVPMVLLCDPWDEDRAAAHLRSGAADVLPKGNLARLGPVVRRALEVGRASAAWHRAEDAHARAVSLLRATLEATAEGILVVDLAGRVAVYNRRFLALFGIPDYVMAPMEVDRVFQFLAAPFPDAEALLTQLRRLGAHPDPGATLLLRSSDARTLEASSHPHLVGGEPAGWVLGFREVTGP